MVKVNVEVLNAVVDGKGKGEKIVLDERSAGALERIGYVKVLSKVADEKGTSAPKKTATKKSAPAPKKEPTKKKSKDK